MAKKTRDSKKHAEYQKEWRSKNRSKAKAIWTKSRRKKIREDEAFRKKLSESRAEHNRMRNLGFDQQPRSKKRWEPWEIAALYIDSDASIRQVSEALGRSYKSVEKARVKYLEYAPAGFILGKNKSNRKEIP